MSPELLDPYKFGLEKSHPTKKSDCYGLGMVVYEVLSGQTPFAEKTSADVIQMVLNEERPEIPHGDRGKLFTGVIWGVLERCWKHQPNDRTNVEAVLEGLEWNPLQLGSTSDAGGDVGPDSDSQLGPTVGEVFLRFISGSPLITLAQ